MGFKVLWPKLTRRQKSYEMLGRIKILCFFPITPDEIQLRILI